MEVLPEQKKMPRQERIKAIKTIFKLELQFFHLYFCAAHFKLNISMDECKQIFETTM